MVQVIYKEKAVLVNFSKQIDNINKGKPFIPRCLRKGLLMINNITRQYRTAF